MKIETKYNVGDKVWLKCKDVEEFIKEHPYEELQKILESCFHEGHVNVVKAETSLLNNEPFVSYIISNTHSHLNNDPLSDIAYKNRLYYDEENIFSNFDEVTNMIKEIHKDVLNNLKNEAEEALKKYE